MFLRLGRLYQDVLVPATCTLGLLGLDQARCRSFTLVLIITSTAVKSSKRSVRSAQQRCRSNTADSAHGAVAAATERRGPIARGCGLHAVWGPQDGLHGAGAFESSRARVCACVCTRRGTFSYPHKFLERAVFIVKIKATARHRQYEFTEQPRECVHKSATKMSGHRSFGGDRQSSRALCLVW